jgi:GNAT superfamily N-acetyltransferase
MMTYNHPYYDRLIASYGFQKTQDLYAYWGNLDIHEKLDPKLLTLVAEVSKRMNITFRYMDKSRFKSEVRAFLDIYNRSLESTWGFVPLSPEEVDHMAAGLKYLIEPKLCAVAEVQGQPIGSVFGLLDYNPRIKEINGRLFPFGFIRLLSSKRKIHRCRLISTNVVPQYQRWGVGLALLHHLYPEAAGWGIREAEFSWILESNRLSWGTLDRAGAKRMKTYRLYDLDFKKGERKA